MIHNRHNGEIFKKHHLDEIVDGGIAVCHSRFSGHDPRYGSLSQIHTFAYGPQDIELRDDSNHFHFITDYGQPRLTAGNDPVRSVFYCRILSYSKLLTHNMQG